MENICDKYNLSHAWEKIPMFKEHPESFSGKICPQSYKCLNCGIKKKRCSTEYWKYDDGRADVEISRVQ